jgi:excisionase family DNA binding protein
MPAEPATRLVVTSADELRALVSSAVADAMAGRVEAPAGRRDGLLTRAELADALRCSTSTVDRLVQRGMPAVRLLGERRYRLDACLAWLESERADD